MTRVPLALTYLALTQQPKKAAERRYAVGRALLLN